MIINIKKFGGELEIRSPSLATCFEFVSLWSTKGEDTAELGRLCAGAIGVSIDHLSKLPKYNPAKHRPSSYGHICLDRMLTRGILPSEIYQEGIKCLSLMTSKIPSQDEVDEKVNFTTSDDTDTLTSSG